MLWYSEITATHLSDRVKEGVKESEGGERRAGVTLLQIPDGCLSLGHVAGCTSVYLWFSHGIRAQKKPFIVILCLFNHALFFFGCVSYDNVQKHHILFYDGLIFQSKRCAVILAAWYRTLTRWFVCLISPVGNLASEITPFLSLRSSSISCPNGGQSHSGVLGGQPWVGGRMRGATPPPIFIVPSLSFSLSQWSYKIYWSHSSI